MMTIKVENPTMIFSELKAGDIFVFTTAPECPYIKTVKNYSIDVECEECNEENSIDMGAFCVELTTGAFYEACAWNKVILYKSAELVLTN